MMTIGDARFDLPKEAISLLTKLEIFAPQQFVDLVDADPVRMSKLLKFDAKILRAQVVRHLTQDRIRTAIMRTPLPPLTGIASPSEVPPASTAEDGIGDRIAEVLDALPPLPNRISLEDKLPPVFSQHSSGTCVGQSVAALRSYFLPDAMSGEFLYKIAKQLDGLGEGIEGTFLRYGCEATFSFGAVPQSAYSYDDFIDDRPVDPLYPLARRARVRGYASLLAGLTERQHLPKILHAVLAGQLIPGVGPRPIPITTPVFDSMMTDTARDTGLFHLPLPGEVPRGGHAWLMTGVARGTPDAPGKRDYAILRNSWSRGWARDNPLGLPGHALVPMRFFETASNVYEAYLILAEAAPHVPMRVH